MDDRIFSNRILFSNHKSYFVVCAYQWLQQSQRMIKAVDFLATNSFLRAFLSEYQFKYQYQAIKR